jgi:hypothetical protein
MKGGLRCHEISQIMTVTHASHTKAKIGFSRTTFFMNGCDEKTVGEHILIGNVHMIVPSISVFFYIYIKNIVKIWYLALAIILTIYFSMLST